MKRAWSNDFYRLCYGMARLGVDVGDISEWISLASKANDATFDRLLKELPGIMADAAKQWMGGFEFMQVENQLKGKGCVVSVVDDSTVIEIQTSHPAPATHRFILAGNRLEDAREAARKNGVYGLLEICIESPRSIPRKPGADNLLAWMRENEVTQTELANLLNVSQSAISQWSTGRAIPGVKTQQILEAVSEKRVLAGDWS